ncbi:MAG: nitrous oxide reductase family maturation protein NosD [Hydrogenimonas sp.]|nr:nitrous oxide reductase family maturation protein NosD [Hydrogenimonas sp.]
MKAALAISLSIALCFAQNIQEIIDSAEPGSMIELPAGSFTGPIVIKKPIVLKGTGAKTVIDGNGSSKIITILSSDVIIKDLTIRNGGKQRYSLDSAIFIGNASRVRIERCKIEDTLFGIILSLSDSCAILENNISSYEEKVADNRGDAIRLWRSDGNIIEGNRIEKSRDISLMRSDHNIIDSNIMKDSRYGIYLENCKDVNIENNEIVSNYVGIISAMSADVEIENNLILKTHLSTGVGVVIRGGGVHMVRKNTIMRHAQAFYIDSSPAERGTKRYIEYNRISLNNEAFHFHAIIKNNTIRYNNIFDNLSDAVKNIRHTKSYDNNISFNYWDRYEGFDMDGDGVGDTPYSVLVYADKLWHYDHHMKFFYATPVLSLIDFIERLAPFSEPLLLMQDEKPKIAPIKNTGALLESR